MKPFAGILVAFSICVPCVPQVSPAIPPGLNGTARADQSLDSGPSLADMARKLRKDHSEDKQMTTEDAKKLFSAVDRIAAFASEDSGLPLRTTIKRRVVSPDEVEKETRAKM